MKLSSSLKEIGRGAFFYCNGLTNVVIPKSVETIGDVAFSGCENLTELTVEKGNNNFKSRDGMLFNTDETRLLTVLTNVESLKIPSTTTILDDYFCAFNKRITSVTIPDNVT